ncbi:Chitooligosaccharidolytic beta-N-acetylglucosaminidase [Camponotus floridanus]|uniref:Beta-hexosaminidase n=1 Tax=Camponotus floridanus TaxID=104421 RepID=E2AC60_CAMFO|nr:chitooligosaccharidolytic beta-N-acetylglucosaminidase [Camponotus floridanus]EFN68976.1 Chitooligosaccharidolytic beta-N-acetylglucosaminidase [Camponotus floridanus]
MLALLIIVFVFGSVIQAEEYTSPWHYKCDGGLCKKVLITEMDTNPVALSVCQLSCGQSGTLWPKPTGHFSIGNTVVPVNPENIVLAGISTETVVGNLLQKVVDRLKKDVKRLGSVTPNAGGTKLVIRFDEKINLVDAKLTLNTNESYVLHVAIINGEIEVYITATTYFGARHAIETLSQLIVFDDLRNQIQIASEVYIVDSPRYPYRGIVLDTSRNYVDKETILRTIDGMAMSKLNTFHWHITDTQSFPYVSRTWPDFAKYGSYDPTKIYTPETIREIVDYALVRGVRVLPEFDAPAHVGEGWQWVGDNATVCFKAEPWKNYCVEPPCGQLNPTSEKMYEVLEGIYKDMIEDFQQPDIFHMGGDEVNINCWNSTSVITNWMLNKGWDLSESSFYLLWNYFQERALEKLKIANGGKDIPAILWTSGLTSEKNLEHIDPKKYIIQIWTTHNDATIGRLLHNNFTVIFSNYDALYLDCGFAAWVGDGLNWCSPYKGWQKIYDNSPLQIIKNQGYGNKAHLILGGEAALWTEQADSTSIDSRLWPRSAAMAERLWSEPDSNWLHAEPRMLMQRERLVERGINADSLQPEWCLQNQGSCYA